MISSELPQSLDPALQHEEVVEFPDNRLLIDLCGEFDRNLAEIEQKLSVQIMRRGNQLVAVGEEVQAKAAIEVLQALYQRLGDRQGGRTGRYRP